ncbi:MAG: TadE/TadG family type IV pilus assembly protein [Altererythrobacter sp.]
MTRLRKLSTDSRGAAAIEFALLGPLLISLLLGVLMIGTQMQTYNALRSVASDVNRYTVVEYQKQNELNTSEIKLMANSIARRSPYNLSPDKLDVTVNQETISGITGAKKFKLTLSYTPMKVNGLFEAASPTMTESMSIIVAD